VRPVWRRRRRGGFCLNDAGDAGSRRFTSAFSVFVETGCSRSSYVQARPAADALSSRRQDMELRSPYFLHGLMMSASFGLIGERRLTGE
jgi:hypothetical protein